MKRLLFLCTGNYYRSRYAELLFNTLAPAAGLRWTADSRGLDLASGVNNIGPLSRFVSERLERRGMDVPAARFPQQLAEADLAAAHLVIALKEAEHRPLLSARFGTWAERIEYWHVHDIDQSSPDQALALIETQIEGLIARLA